MCRLCNSITEDLEHFILDCLGYSDIRQTFIILRRPLIENTEQIISDFLVNEDTTQENKEILYSLWTKRSREPYNIKGHNNNNNN